uniref:Uncharacterized protein n=1 Tax=Caenorhabditis japonica TaxID=281687 RepID=A0A8R1IS40_CAEJA
MLLKQADIFFQSFFTKKLATNTFWRPLVLVGITMVVVFISVLAVVFLWIGNFKIEQCIDQDEEKVDGLDEK